MHSDALAERSEDEERLEEASSNVRDPRFCERRAHSVVFSRLLLVWRCVVQQVAQ